MAARKNSHSPFIRVSASLSAFGAQVGANMQAFGGNVANNSPVCAQNFFANEMLSYAYYRTTTMGPTKRKPTLLPVDYRVLSSERLIRVRDCATFYLICLWYRACYTVVTLRSILAT